MATTTKTPLFSIDVFERQCVRIFGQVCELKHQDELSIVENNRVLRLCGVVDGADSENLSDEQAAAISTALKALVDLILDAPAELRERMTDINRMRVVQGFIGLTRATAQAATSPDAKGEETVAPPAEVAEASGAPASESSVTPTGEN